MRWHSNRLLLSVVAHMFPHFDTATAVVNVLEMCIVALAGLGFLVTHVASN